MNNEGFKQQGEQQHASAVDALRKHHDKCYVLFVLDASSTTEWPSELFIQTRNLGPAGAMRFNIIVLEAILKAFHDSARDIMKLVVPDDPIFEGQEEE